MRYSFIYLFTLSIFLLSCNFSNDTVGKPYAAQLVAQESVALDPIDSIQSKVYDAFVQGMMERSEEPLIQVDSKLDKLYEKSPNKLIQYWKAYHAYYEAIFHLQMEQKGKAEEAVDAGIDLLENMEGKNSEDYALLSLLQSFSLQFKSGVKIPFLAGKVKDNAEKAIDLDPKNPRAYYVFASNDFYTPEKHGGGKEAESYLLKAIELPAQHQPNPYLPSWGVEEAYLMLVKLYIKKEAWDKAKRYFQEALEKYPQNYRLQELAPKLVGK